MHGMQYCTRFYGNPSDMLKTLLENYDVQRAHCNWDHEPQAIERKTEIHQFFYHPMRHLVTCFFQLRPVRPPFLDRSQCPLNLYTAQHRKEIQGYHCANFLRARGNMKATLTWP